MARRWSAGVSYGHELKLKQAGGWQWCQGTGVTAPNRGAEEAPVRNSGCHGDETRGGGVSEPQAKRVR